MQKVLRRCSLLASGEHLSLEGVDASFRPLFLSSLFRAVKKERRSLLVLVEHNIEIYRLIGELTGFAPEVAQEGRLLAFPTTGTYPFENQSPDHQAVYERLTTLNALAHGRRSLVITTPSALFGKVMPKGMLNKNRMVFKTGDEFRREDIEFFLYQNGYRPADLVEERGSYSFRGDIFDIFPSHMPYPLRLEFWGDTLESVRMFKPESQRAFSRLESFFLLPSREIILTEDMVDNATEKIISRGRSLGVKESFITSLVMKIKSFRYIPGIELYAPYCYPLGSLFDYLPEDVLLLHEGEESIKRQVEEWEAQIVQGEENANVSFDIFPERKELYLSLQEVEKHLTGFSQISLHRLRLNRSAAAEEGIRAVSVSLKRNDIKDLAAKIKKWHEEEKGVFLFISLKQERERLYTLLAEEGIAAEVLNGFPEDFASDAFSGKTRFIKGKLRHSFHLPDQKRVFLAEGDIFGKIVIRKRSEKKRKAFLDTLKYLQNGDLVVHQEHGIGIYQGLERIDGYGDEFVTVQYRDKQKLYVPMENIGLLSRYVGAKEEDVPIDKMGGIAWKKRKAKVRRAVDKVVAFLVELYAKRSTLSGYAYGEDADPHEEFAASFEFEETDDQLSAIADITGDLEKPRPMDRLLCGDVGFGKTEVAMRAAFKVAFENRQVAVLVPTTILAYQHYQSFSKRFERFPFRIEMLNRLRTAKEQKQVLEELKKGEIDILIGTHRLLSKDVQFQQLGLVIIDEEHRFGVSAKEKLKKLRQKVDVLTLTATPIPRTLQFSLLGIRDMSVIATPPKKRMPIKTYLRRFGEEVIEAAIRLELKRGGQVYFIHNTIETIETVASVISQLVPEARIRTAHGRMKGETLQELMTDFTCRKFDILVCTTIVESGIDIPTANTIIINNADRFGLSQLYQLRGRVGRYEHKAYAYLLVNDEESLSETAKERLIALEEMTELGAGFQLSMKDLEIRGGGNLLGLEQSGQIMDVGFEMYSRMVEEAVSKMQRGDIDEEPDETLVLRVGKKGSIPAVYIADDTLRLDMYKKLFTAAELPEVVGYGKEMTDRFGKMPDETRNLMKYAELRAIALELRCRLIEKKGSLLDIHLLSRSALTGKELEGFLKKNSKWVSFKTPQHLQMRLLPSDNIVTIVKIFKHLRTLVLK